MILVFGGTTEGRRAVEVLEEAGNVFFYSTKTGEQDITLHHGQRIDGALDAEAMQVFCQEHNIRLIVDAAHPFASQLHQTILRISETLLIPVIRYERIYPPRDPDITWIDDYDEIPLDIHSLLATTGVQSIAKLKPLEAAGISIYYRILNRASSVALALKQGASREQLVYYEDPGDIPVEAEAILLKESGITGGFPEKVEAAKNRGMRVIALKRPQWPMVNSQCSMVNGPHGLRRAVEHLLPAFFPLHSGLTTGTCATAAALAAAIQRLRRMGEEPLPFLQETEPAALPTVVPVVLPDGETISVPVGYGDGYAYCVKEAGDDPDVTNGIEIRAAVERSDHFEIVGGEGVGRFTLPGFDYPPGEAAINKGPREMISQNLHTLASSYAPIPERRSPVCSLSVAGGKPMASFTVTISVPGGEEIAKKTFNPRLGIEGGISIIGVSGIVKPYSEEAFIGSIRKCMTVAKASGTSRVVLNSGAKSERFLKEHYPDLPQQAFVQYGNYIGETLKMAAELDFKEVTLGVMLGKAVKLAAGHLDTHSRKSTMDKAFVGQLLAESGLSIDISDITLARELWKRLPADGLDRFTQTVIRHCADHCRPLFPDGTLTILLIDEC
ncbi:MAG: cobalt-precorrin-5B (C(1))-methyltransferase CbiD [Prevotella sp.]|nr:cobalt-precorrin-5B (C(1))-methyltransferase CbiD [Prevotella sp.]